MNRTLIAPVMILAALGAAACSDTSPTDIQTAPSYSTIGGQTFVANFDKGESVRLEATGGAPTYANGSVWFNGWDRGYLRTLDAYNGSNFRADVIVTQPGTSGSEEIAFIGLGGGAPGWFYGEPTNGPTVYLRIMPTHFFGPAIQITDATTGFAELAKTEGVGGTGTHRVRMSWDPATGTVSFAIHHNYVAGSEFVASATTSHVVDPGVFGESGARIFMGGAAGVSFDRLQVTVSSGSM